MCICNGFCIDKRGLRGQDLYAVESSLCGSCYDVLIPYATWICYSSSVGFQFDQI